MRIVAHDEHLAGARCMDWSVEIQRKRDALRSYLAVLEEARRRLDEIQHDTNGVDFYPLDTNDDDLPENEHPMQWQDQVCRHMVNNNSVAGRYLRIDGEDLVGHLAADFDNLDDDGEDGDEISRGIVALGLHVPHIQHAGTATTPPSLPGEEAAARGHGFGAVPASVAAITGLEEHRYNGSSHGGDSTCVICMQDYKKGRRLRVMPCAYKHRFHGRCIREWLSHSNMCPLCRHALPTTADKDQGQLQGGGGVRSCRVTVRVNVSPY